jgi:hypothetical protein
LVLVPQSADQAYRLWGNVLRAEFHHATALQHLLLRYTQALLTQIAQAAVCNRHHSVDQQLCRWLLLRLDRLPTNIFSMTQELIANMLGSAVLRMLPSRQDGVRSFANPTCAANSGPIAGYAAFIGQQCARHGNCASQIEPGAEVVRITAARRIKSGADARTLIAHDDRSVATVIDDATNNVDQRNASWRVGRSSSD